MVPVKRLFACSAGSPLKGAARRLRRLRVCRPTPPASVRTDLIKRSGVRDSLIQTITPLREGRYGLVPVKRFELPTHALRMRCSTN